MHFVAFWKENITLRAGFLKAFCCWGWKGLFFLKKKENPSRFRRENGIFRERACSRRETGPACLLFIFTCILTVSFVNRRQARPLPFRCRVLLICSPCVRFWKSWCVVRKKRPASVCSKCPFSEPFCIFCTARIRRRKTRFPTEFSQRCPLIWSSRFPWDLCRRSWGIVRIIWGVSFGGNMGCRCAGMPTGFGCSGRSSCFAKQIKAWNRSAGRLDAFRCPVFTACSEGKREWRQAHGARGERRKRRFDTYQRIVTQMPGCDRSPSGFWQRLRESSPEMVTLFSVSVTRSVTSVSVSHAKSLA